MKLYVWRPSGYGEKTFATMAQNKGEAKAIINEHIRNKYTSADGNFKYAAGGWNTDYYKATEYGPGEVFEHAND